MASKKTAGKKVALKVGMSVAAAAAAAAGYFFYASKDAEKNRKKAAAWAGKFKKDVMAKVKESGVMDSKTVKKAVSEVEKAYKNVKNVDVAELAVAAKELKGNWDKLKEEVEKGVKKGAKAVKKAAKKKTK